MEITANRLRTHGLPIHSRWGQSITALLPQALMLAVLYGAIFVVHANQLGLYLDDWGYLEGISTHSVSALATTFPMDYRPLEELPWLLLNRAFGTNLTGYYVVFFVIRYATSLLVYLFTRRLTGNGLFAFACAVIWSVFPSDTSVFWLTSFAYRLGALFLLASATLLLFSRSGQTGTSYWAALVCCVLCLFSNELFLGLCVSLPALTCLGSRLSRSQCWRRALPFLTATAIYLTYREWMGPRVFHFIDPKPTGLTVNPVILALRLLQGGFVQFLGGWMASAVGLWGSNPRVLVAAACVVAWLVALAGLLLVLDRSHGTSQSRPLGDPSAISPGLPTILFGLAVVSIGYVPLVFTGVPPALGEVSSRVNAAGSIGATIFFAGIAWIIAHRPNLRPRVSRGVFLALICAFTLGGIATQEHAAHTYAAAWASQRSFWRSTVRVTHRLKPGSTIILLAPRTGAWDTVESLPPASFQAAFALMYPAAHAGGIVLLRREMRACGGMGMLESGIVRSVRLQRTGVRYLDTGQFVPYTRTVVLEYAHPGRGKVQSDAPDRILGTHCRISGNPSLLLGRPLRPSPWWHVAVSRR